MKIKSLIVILGVIFCDLLSAKTITTNTALVIDAPDWLKSVDVRKVSESIERKLEWSTRRINVHFHRSQKDFSKIHNFGSRPTAVTISTKEKSVIHLGPKVTKKNFAQIYGHELVHVIINQKYRGAIPKWLEEGLANFYAKKGKVDYKWLSRFPVPSSIEALSHPFQGDYEKISYRYMVSQALVEMLDRKCKIERLVQLSVERKMEDYIKTFCEIPDLSKALGDWIQKKRKLAHK